MEETTSSELTTPEYYTRYISPCNKEDVYAFVVLFTTILNSCFFIFGITGNILVIWILIIHEQTVSLTNLFILNLSIADLILTTCLPFFVVYHRHGWVFGPVTCKVFNVLFSLGFYSGIIFLTCLTYYRYVAIVDPLSVLKTKRHMNGVLITVLSWSVSIFACIPVMIFQVQTSLVDIAKCEYGQIYPVLISHYQQNISFFCAFCFIVYCYVRIIRTLNNSRSQMNHKPVKLILVIVALYLVSWAPYNIVLFLQSFHHHQFLMRCELTKNLEYAKYITEKIVFSHCCLNPVLYAFVGIKFRRHLKGIIKCNLHSKHKQQQGTRSVSQDHNYNEMGSVF
ncbi:chemokine XC receptor 1-like [Bufo gargarizans]|uniref:chemokine XC receptor 1-like n=1 Tax=Bufo gargarizans TaxID=30331 RepID=UPI001CF29FC5|nr:chemokine XC receptor 1-like [Bufo gargarizans]